jgi:hypothetical protein
LAVLLAAPVVTGSSKSSYILRDKALFADKPRVGFVRPVLGITIDSANITGSGAINVTYTLTIPLVCRWRDYSGRDLAGVRSGLHSEGKEQ